jgi:hypothetical protein
VLVAHLTCRSHGKVKTHRVNSPNGEIHFILKESQSYEHGANLKASEIAKIKKITRKEAEKPLILLREE